MFDGSMADLDLICGVDEVGRGPWAGPVMAGAVILDPCAPIDGLADSKKLSESRRLDLSKEIQAKAAAWAIAAASAEEIDRLNIREATFLAMRRAISDLPLKPDLILIDGNALPSNLPAPARAIIKGDQTEACISAAAIIAKVARDQLMAEFESQYPGYGFGRHKGYGTKLHSAALTTHGPCDIHRRSFAPVRASLA